MTLTGIPRTFAAALTVIKTDLTAMAALANELKADMHQHVHGGVNSGGANSGQAPAITSASVTVTVGAVLTGLPRFWASEFQAVKNDLTALATLANELKTDLHQHVHGSIQAGGATSGAGPSIAAAAITLQTTATLAQVPRSWASQLQPIITDLTGLATLLNELRTDMSAHTHGGITAGATNTGAGPAITSAAVTLQTS